MNLEALRAALKEAKVALDAYPGTIKGDDGNVRRMNKEELGKYKTLIEEVDDLSEQVKLAEEAARKAANNGTSTTTEERDASGRLKKNPAEARGEEKAFDSFGTFLKAVAQRSAEGDIQGQGDSRLIYGKAAGANETVPSEGGFLVGEDFSNELLRITNEGGELMRQVRTIPISSNSNALRLPILDETSRVRGSRAGGVRAYWLAEGEQKIDSKPKFGEIRLTLNKIAALGYATDELLQDSTALESIMMTAFANEIRFEVEDAILNGDGAGKPLGILKSGAVISVARESGQAAGTINFANVAAMWSHLPVASRRRAVWLLGDGAAEASLYSIVLPGTNIPIFLPPGQNSATQGNATYGTLFGRPVIPTEYLPGLAAAGGLMLVDLDEYLMINKGGMQAAQSMHVRFIWDEQCFRLVYRTDGQPTWRQPHQNAAGDFMKSPFVALAAG